MSDIEPLSNAEQICLGNMLLNLKQPVIMTCDYRNWRGDTSRRRIQLVSFWHGATEWHSEPGLMLKAIDLEKQAERDFRVEDFDLSTALLEEGGVARPLKAKVDVNLREAADRAIQAEPDLIAAPDEGYDAWLVRIGRDTRFRGDDL